MKIDWRKTQRNIGAGVDGDPGRETWGRLMAKAAARPFDDTMLRVGEGAAKYFPRYGVSTSLERAAGTIAEIAHETADFRRWEEDLSYSAERLAEVWPYRFAINPAAKVKLPNATAKRIARRPAEIAKATYGLRMGNLAGVNDNDQNEDGWQYRGRGATMLTGKGNYYVMGGLTGLDLVRFPELAADPATSMLIACVFYDRSGAFEAMDAGLPLVERRAINGGLIGLEQVQQIRGEALRLIVAA